MKFPATIKGIEIPRGDWTEISAEKAKVARDRGFPLLVMLDESQHATWSMKPDYDMHCWAFQNGEEFVEDENASYYFLTTYVAGAWKRGERNSRLHFYVMKSTEILF